MFSRRPSIWPERGYLCPGSSSLNRPRPVTSLNWLAKTTFDPLDEGVRDTRDITSAKYSNVAGFTIMAFLGFPNLLTP